MSLAITTNPRSKIQNLKSNGAFYRNTADDDLVTIRLRTKLPSLFKVPRLSEGGVVVQKKSDRFFIAAENAHDADQDGDTSQYRLW